MFLTVITPLENTRTEFHTRVFRKARENRESAMFATIDINRSGLPARMFFAWKLALSVENN